MVASRRASRQGPPPRRAHRPAVRGARGCAAAPGPSRAARALRQVARASARSATGREPSRSAMSASPVSTAQRQRGAQVVVILLEPIERRALVGRHHARARIASASSAKSCGMARAQRVVSAALRWPARARTRGSSRASRSAARRRRPRTGGRGSSRPATRARRARLRPPRLGADPLDGLEPRPSDEDREGRRTAPCPGSSSMSWLQAIAPRRVCWRSGRSRAPPARSAEAVLEPAEHRLRREDSDARRRQLDGQRQAVESHADLGHGRRVLVGDLEVGLHRAGALDEERDRLELRELGERREVRRVGQAERRNRVLLLARHAQHAAAARQDGQVRAGRQQRVDRWRRVDHLLEVVEHQQHPPLADVVDQPIDRAAPPAVRKAERLGDRGGDELRLA